MKKILNISLLGILSISMIGCSSNPIKVKKDTVTLEYGNVVSDNVSDYLDTDKMDKNVIDNIKMDKTISLVEGKDYPALGEYTIHFTYKDSSDDIKLIVKDTTKPTFKDFKKVIEIYKDCKPSEEEYSKMFTAEDLDTTTIKVDDSQVDYSKTGDYKVNVTASDTSKNETVQEATVKVLNPTIKINTNSKTLYVKETMTLKAEVKGKDDKVSYKSSDSTVASVEGGKVTAKKKGTATIVAECNGVKAECKVTVKNAPSNAIVKKDNSGNTVVISGGSSSGGGNSSGGSSSTSGSNSNKTSQTATTSQECFNLINQERAKAGLTPYVWDSAAASVAKIRAKEITTKFSHVRPDGSSVTDGVNGTWYAEILASGPSNASRAVTGWMNSSGHKHAILNPEYTKGAVVRCGNYWVGLFTI